MEKDNNFETKIDIEQLLKDGNRIKIKPQGYSMYPLFIPGRDEAIIEQVPLSTFRRGDVALYRRKHGILVLHRICKKNKNGFYMVGDNQSEIEGPLSPEQIKGKLVQFVRNGHRYDVSNPLYRFFVFVWLLCLPIRPACFALSKFLKKLLKLK